MSAEKKRVELTKKVDIRNKQKVALSKNDKDYKVQKLQQSTTMSNISKGNLNKSPSNMNKSSSNMNK